MRTRRYEGRIGSNGRRGNNKDRERRCGDTRREERGIETKQTRKSELTSSSDNGVVLLQENGEGGVHGGGGGDGGGGGVGGVWVG